MLTAFPQTEATIFGHAFLTPEQLHQRLSDQGQVDFEPVLEFQRNLAGRIFYRGPGQKRTDWGLPHSGPERGEGEVYTIECVNSPYADPFIYELLLDGSIELDWLPYVRHARTLVEIQALQYEWDTEVEPFQDSYYLNFGDFAREDQEMLQKLQNVATVLNLSAVPEVQDDNQHWYVGKHSRIQVEPYFGLSRGCREDVPRFWTKLHTTSLQEAQEIWHLLYPDWLGAKPEFKPYPHPPETGTKKWYWMA